MKRLVVFLSVVCAVFCVTSSLMAGGIDNRSNHSADYIRSLNRNAATDSADTVIYNPAGVMSMEDGTYIKLDAQYTVVKELTNSIMGMGFESVKFDLDTGFQGREALGWEPYNQQLRNDELDWMVEVTEAVRNAVGDGIELMVDLHGSYNVTSAIKIAKALEPYNLTWLEEPVPAENVDAMREVKRSTSTPICAGENLHSAWRFRRLLEEQAVSIIEPDLNKCGGILEGQRIANMADLQYIPVAPHNTSTPVGTLAACHLCASIPNFVSLEWHGLREAAEWSRLVKWDGPIIKDGYIMIPNKPGLGFELNEEACLEANPEAEVLFT